MMTTTMMMMTMKMMVMMMTMAVYTRHHGSAFLCSRVIFGFYFNFITSSLVSFQIYGSTTNISEHTNTSSARKSFLRYPDTTQGVVLWWYPTMESGICFPNYLGILISHRTVYLSKISRNPNSGGVSHALMQIGMCKTDVPPPGVYSVYITHQSLIMMTIIIIMMTMLVTMIMIYDLHRWYIIVLL